MSGMGIPADAVSIAQQLLELVKSIASPIPGTENETRAIDSLTAWNAKIQIQNLCDRLLIKTMGPLEYTVVLAESCQESQALHFATSLGIADFIGDDEESLVALSEKAVVQPQFLGVVMSCLVGRGYFEEVGKFGSRVYRNNELSQVLRENHPSTLKSAIGLAGDEGFRATSRLLDAAKVTSSPSVSNPKQNPAMNIAFDFSGSVFEWMATPEQAWRGERVGKAMQQLHRVANSNVPEDYPWHNLASPIVDVGGGIGSLEMSLVKIDRYNHLNFILFDLPKTIENAKKMWSTQLASSPGRLSFAEGSFMAPTLAESKLPQGKPTYIIRHVLHDWTDDDVLSILSTVRQAMANQGRLLVLEILLREESSRFVRTTSMQLLALNSGVTRTQGEMEELLKRAGFKVDRVTHVRAVDSVIEAVLE